MTREEATEVILEGVWLECKRCGTKGFEVLPENLCTDCGHEGFIKHPQADEACLVLGITIPEKPRSAIELFEKLSERFRAPLNRPSRVWTTDKLDVDDDKGAGR